MSTTNEKSWSTCEVFQYYDPHMLEHYNPFWTNVCEYNSIKKPLQIIDVREKVITHFENIEKNFKKVLENKIDSYDEKKSKQSHLPKLEKELNDKAFDRMKALFKERTPDLLKILGEINECTPQIKTYFIFMKKFINNQKEFSSQDILITLEKMNRFKAKLSQFRFELNSNIVSLQKEIANLKKEGELIGPSFKANPVIFLLGSPFFCESNSVVAGKSIEDKITIMETLKARISVSSGLQPIYLLYVNAIQSMRKMIKGISLYVGKSQVSAELLKQEEPQRKRPEFNTISEPMKEPIESKATKYFFSENIKYNQPSVESNETKSSVELTETKIVDDC